MWYDEKSSHSSAIFEFSWESFVAKNAAIIAISGKVYPPSHHDC
jgi:hypothetical protein